MTLEERVARIEKAIFNERYDITLDNVLVSGNLTVQGTLNVQRKNLPQLIQDLQDALKNLLQQFAIVSWAGGAINEKLYEQLSVQSFLVLLSEHVRGSGRNWETLEWVPARR